MSLPQMSFSGAVMILVILIIRALAINRLPKKTFCVLWGVVLARLLLPYSLPSIFSVYSLAGRLTPAAEVPETLPMAHIVPVTVTVTPSPSIASSAPIRSMDPWAVIWLAGMAACAVFFAVSYWKCRREFRESLPVENGFVKSWLTSHRLHRVIEVRQSDKISAPLTYGVFRPVILLPKRTDWEDETALAYVLAHEYVHIRRFDAVTKLALTAALCVHWFNPAVWIMYTLANRDIELSCDEAVVRLFGEQTKSAYALTLIRMEETRSGLTPFCNNFSKCAIEERIIAIMKMKKTTWGAALAALALVVGVTTAFATTGQIAAAQDNNTVSAATAYTESSLMSYVNPSDGKTYYSWDNGATWTPLTDEEFEEMYPTTNIEWWTVEEYEAWLEQEKADLQSIIGEKSWNPTEGWYTWTQEKVDEAIALYEQTLQELKDGKMVSKIVYDGDGEATQFTMSYDPQDMSSIAESDKTAVYIIEDSEEVDLSEYAPFGVTEKDGMLFYNGELVRYFTDSADIDGNIATAYQYWNGDGTVDIHTVRQAAKNADGSTDPFGKLTGIEEYKAGELDLDALFADSMESVATGGTTSESADQSGQVSVVTGDYYAIESGDTGTDFMADIAKYAPFGVTFVKSGSFGDLYWNGKLVDVLVDDAPDGTYLTISSTDEGGVKIQTVYDGSGDLIGVEKI